MLTDAQRDALESAWTSARAAGVLGPADITEIDEHAAGFLPAALSLSGEVPLRAIDMGTGAGIPGVLLAVALPRSTWRLVDADGSRLVHARAAVACLGLDDRVMVAHARVDELGHEPGWRGSADLVVARLFGPPSEVLECGLPLVARAGRLVVSVARSRLSEWSGLDLGPFGAMIERTWDTATGAYVAVARTGAELDDRLPRRPAARRRAPLV